MRRGDRWAGKGGNDSDSFGNLIALITGWESIDNRPWRRRKQDLFLSFTLKKLTGVQHKEKYIDHKLSSVHSLRPSVIGTGIDPIGVRLAREVGRGSNP